MDVSALHEGNRDAWDRAAREVYAGEVERDVAFLRGGGVSLMTQEIGLLGEPRDRAIHLQCSHGLDALSLLNLGFAEVVGVDISEAMLAQARAKSDALGARARWVRADVIEAPHDLNGAADLVYTGKGALPWMMDLDAWAATVFRLLRPGGRLLLFEGHPLDSVWEEDADGFRLRRGGSYFADAPAPERSFPYEAARRADPEAPVRLTSRVWTVSEVVTALVRAGLRIARLEEFPEPFWDQFKRIAPAEFRRLPHTYAVVAERPT